MLFVTLESAQLNVVDMVRFAGASLPQILGVKAASCRAFLDRRVREWKYTHMTYSVAIKYITQDTLPFYALVIFFVVILMATVSFGINATDADRGQPLSKQHALNLHVGNNRLRLNAFPESRTKGVKNYAYLVGHPWVGASVEKTLNDVATVRKTIGVVERSSIFLLAQQYNQQDVSSRR